METFADFLAEIQIPEQRERLEELFHWIREKYPDLEKVVKWNQPMFTAHDTYIIGFSVSKKHLAVAPESVTVKHVEEDIKKTGYDYTKEIIRIPWTEPVDYSLIEKMIEFNLWDKKDTTTFWRK